MKDNSNWHDTAAIVIGLMMVIHGASGGHPIFVVLGWFGSVSGAFFAGWNAREDKRPENPETAQRA